jgi:hypothetical protein
MGATMLDGHAVSGQMTRRDKSFLIDRLFQDPATH